MEGAWKSADKRKRSTSVVQAIKLRHKDTYPNIYILLRILGIVAVTSCECKRYEAYLGASMEQTR